MNSRTLVLRLGLAVAVNIAFGMDAAVFLHGDNAREFAAYVRQGMTPTNAKGGE